jgi:hypothetical protein
LLSPKDIDLTHLREEQIARMLLGEIEDDEQCQ